MLDNWNTMRRICLLMGCLCVAVAQAADERLTFAEGLLRRGLSEQAAVEYEAFLKAPGKTAEEVVNEARFNLAECYEKLGRITEAQKLYQQVASQAKGERAAAAKLRWAISLLESNQPEKALSVLEALSVNKDSADIAEAARYRLAVCYEAVNRPKHAEALYKYIGSNPGKYAAHARLARATLAAKDGRYEEAEALYREILEIESDPERKKDVALAAFSSAYRAERYAEAATFAKEAGEQRLAKHTLLLPAAWAALRCNRPEEARGWLGADKTRHSAASPNRLILEGAVATALEDTQGAITAYERLLSEFPSDAQAGTAAEAMLALRARAGDPEAFLKAYARVATILPEKALPHLMWYRLDAAYQMADAAHTRAAAAWLIENAPAEQAAEASYRLGALEHKEKQYAAAGETWLRTAEKWPAMPSSGRAAFAAACAFRQAEMKDRAEQALALALASGDESVVPEALLLRARDALSEQNIVDAAAALDEYLTRFPQGKAVAESAYLRGLIFFNTQDFKAAADLLEKALSIKGENNQSPLGHARQIDASIRRAQALHSLGQKDEAAALLQPLLGLKDAESLAPTYLRWLADFRLERAEWAEAEAAARVLASKPSATTADKVLAQTLIGRAAQGRGQTATAMAAYEAALALSPEKTAYDADAAVGLGELRLASNEYQKAYDAFTQAIASADMDTAEGRLNRANAYAGLAAACKALGRNAEALRANMSLIIFFDDKTRVSVAFREAIELLEAEGRTREAERLRQELNERYGSTEQ